MQAIFLCSGFFSYDFRAIAGIYHVISCHAMICHAMPCHVMYIKYFVLYHMSSHAISYILLTCLLNTCIRICAPIQVLRCDTNMFSEHRLRDFIVGVTNKHPTTFPHYPDESSVLPFLDVCYNYTGQAELEMLLNCSKLAAARFLVITMPDIRVALNLAEVIVLGTWSRPSEITTAHKY